MLKTGGTFVLRTGHAKFFVKILLCIKVGKMMSINYFCKLFCKDEKCGRNKLVSEPRFEGFELE
ncbi:hypothetical protein HanPSC8_Chr08g0332431 [Helianthus annuus]|nr:hypothetical protein HanPSC8_Chr08g0332431 [Helianthus annuus]